MFVIGLLMSVAGLAMLAGCFFLPAAARPGLIGGAIGVGGTGLLLMLLDWPSRRKPSREGMVKADAYVLDARLTGGEATGYRMVEMTLEVRPRDGIPFQVKRKFIDNLGRIETGQRLSVWYDPLQPEKLELA
jgi:hypothetical protein